MYQSFFLGWVIIGMMSCRDVPYAQEHAPTKAAEQITTKAIEPAITTIDFSGPEFFGPKTGVAQKPYLQETDHYQQRYIDDPEESGYEIEPLGNSQPISYFDTPTFHRWSTHLDDDASAPSFRFMLSDQSGVQDVRFVISQDCQGYEHAIHPIQEEQGIYEAKITQRTADFALNQVLPSGTPLKKYCLSIWAKDRAGNKSNHNVYFFLKTITPPLAVELNSKRYPAQERADDFSSHGKSLRDLFVRAQSVTLKRDLVIGHAIISNPFDRVLSIALELKQPMKLQMSSHEHIIHPSKIAIDYFAYDPSCDQLGKKRKRWEVRY